MLPPILVIFKVVSTNLQKETDCLALWTKTQIILNHLKHIYSTMQQLMATQINLNLCSSNIDYSPLLSLDPSEPEPIFGEKKCTFAFG